MLEYKTGGSHYLLAHMKGGDVWVMNPDGGSDTRQPDLFAWVNGPPASIATIGGVKHIFSGIFVQVS
ncbi:hypothetical protein OPU71_11870 [Niveibacterium sp. 24ML]|uniref:hypothetical protein n=1 Tax=Niveibacterium sp. 24ML TaxID=2985512 RepID=UPI002270C5FA|nr:hypothetical protein [Niveibacterium sp. 24ML]MCX9156824.1 hypothetical protein [Niveibacterium sp. 24ML]